METATGRWLRGTGALSAALAALVLLFSSLLASCATQPSAPAIAVVNAGFEDDSAGRSALPAGWFKAGDGGSWQLDADASSGRYSLKLQRDRDAKFNGISQSVAAATLRGKLVELRARFRSADLGPGNNGLWVQLRDSTKMLHFDSSYAHALPADSGWTERKVLFDVPDHADWIVFGVAVSGSGTLWVDDFVLHEIAGTDGSAMSPAARAYLDDAIGHIRRLAMRAPSVDWPAAERAAYAMAGNAMTPADTHAAIGLVLRRLNDGHSHLMRPDRARAFLDETPAGGTGAASTMLGGIGYVRVPGLMSGKPTAQQALADELNDRIKVQHERGACGWIVDLSTNTGGAFRPMLAGLAPLLEDGVLGQLARGNTMLSQWFMRERSVVDSEGGRDPLLAAGALPPLRFNGLPVPVAVILGARTASAGEAVAVSFIGRPNTRSFGQPTAGLSTANRERRLSDGALLAVTSAVFADRHGKAYGGKIEPDELISAPAAAPAGGDFSAVRAASTWLESQASCRTLAPQAGHPAR